VDKKMFLESLLSRLREVSEEYVNNNGCIAFGRMIGLRDAIEAVEGKGPDGPCWQKAYTIIDQAMDQAAE